MHLSPAELLQNLTLMLPDLSKATYETLYITILSTLFSLVLGLPLGIILVVTDRGHIMEQPWVYKSLGYVVNILRSVPFIILMVAIIPVTRLVIGTTIGTTAAAVPLIVAAAPFVARLVESSLKEVDRGVVQAALSMGASPWQIVWKVLLPEAFPGLVLGVTITTITIIGYSAMAGVIGGGGLGDLAIRYGYQRFQTDVMIVTVIILVILVQLVQWLGDWLAKKINKK